MESFSKTFTAWNRLQANLQLVGAKPAEMKAYLPFAHNPQKGFAFGTFEHNFTQAAFVRGDAAACLIIFEAEETKELFTLLVRQARSIVGRTNLLEMVAGVLDEDQIKIAEKILKEVQEETGQSFSSNDFFNLSNWQTLHARNSIGYHPEDERTTCSLMSPGGLDEGITFFCVKKRLPLAEIKAMHGNVAGNSAEHEKTLVNILPIRDALFVCKDPKFLSAYALYSAYA
jgi:hypothetical protein